jgi:hypothetical protein
MDRYHINVYFPKGIKSLLPEFCKKLNYENWSFSDHYYETLYEEPPKLVAKVRSIIWSYWFDPQEVFEVYVNKGEIEKACFRTTFSEEEDIILVVTKTKCMVTFYRNYIEDHHRTLITNGYVQEVQT